MTTDTPPETLVTQEMEDAKGKWESQTVSPPVSESDIRKWAIATYWPEKPPEIYWNEEYAKTTRFGGLIAPQDFNPFAWPIERQIAPGRATPQGAGVGTRGMNGGQTDTYGVPMKPGDVITTRARLKDWNERQTRLGLTLFQEREVEWRNQDDEVVKTRLSIGIRY